jgi:SAM-dependent methyltransferase
MSLLRGSTYFDYQRRVCTEVVIPWLDKRLPLEGVQVGDFGAHQGGMVEALRESGKVSSAVGLELRKDIVDSSPFVGDGRFRLDIADLMSLEVATYQFDVVLLHDVLEHVPDPAGALRKVAAQVRPGGHIFISFPPYYSAFGGHQQLARGRARRVPFVHLLPARLFLHFASPADQEYMTAADSLSDMVSVREARLTIRGVERAFAEARLELVDSEFFLVRPEYTVRYGLAVRSAGLLGQLPTVREFAVNGAFYLVCLPASPRRP